MIAVGTSSTSPMKGSRLERPAGSSDETSDDLMGTAQRLANRARDVVVQRPGTCLAVGFLLGGVVAWLISKRG